jgi:hypothetical protein
MMKERYRVPNGDWSSVYDHAPERAAPGHVTFFMLDSGHSDYGVKQVKVSWAEEHC